MNYYKFMQLDIYYFIAFVNYIQNFHIQYSTMEAQICQTLQKNKKNKSIQADCHLNKYLQSGAQQITKSQSYMPFVFKSKRSELISSSKKTIPAPGQYQMKSCFDKKDERDRLIERCNIVLYNTRKIKQSAAFKSNLDRFHYREQNQDSRGYYYPYCKKTQYNSCSQINLNSNHRSSQKSSNKKSYPSIPDSSIKYGYKLKNGNCLTKIDKTNDQLQKQKQSMKKYVRNLNEGEYNCGINQKIMSSSNKNWRTMSDLSECSPSKIIDLTKSKIYDRNNKNVSLSNNVSHQRRKKPQKIIKKSTSKYNAKKVEKIAQQKQKIKQKLGPGCYKYAQSSLTSTVNQYKKDTNKYQFFNSTQQRFKQHHDSYQNLDKALNANSKIKKLITFNHFQSSSKNKIQQIRIALRKSNGKSLRNSAQNIDKTYNKENLNICIDINNQNKKTINKNGKKSLIGFRVKKKSCQRISELSYQQNQHKHIIHQDMTKQTNKTGLMKKLSSKKKNTSEYSLCSWDDRPESRSETLNQKNINYLMVKGQ